MSGRKSECAPAPRGEAGFSLMEILLALFLLVIIVTALSRTFSNATRVQKSSYSVEQATAYAQGLMERLSATSLQSVVPGQDTVRTPFNQTFVRSWTTVAKPGGKEVVVTVSWSAAGKTQSVQLATIVK